MGAMILIAKLLFRRIDTANTISISLLLMIIYNPFVLFDTGLILSFGGTIGILLFANYFKKIKNYILKIFAVSVSSQIIIAPIIAYLFCKIHPTFFISGIIATPIFEAIILLGFLFVILSYIFPPICFIIKIPLEICLTIFLKISQITSSLPCTEINIAKPSLAIITIYYIIIAIILIKGIKINKKKIISVLICIALILQIPKYMPSNMHIFFIDVGQGDCTLVQTQNHKTIMIDSGGGENLEEYDVGKKVLVPYLLARGITSLDYIMISHFHADHCNRIYCCYE